MTWSTEPETLFGFPAGSFGEDRRVLSSVHPDDRERVQAAVEAAMSAGSTYECEYRLVRPDGVIVWITERGRVLTGEDGPGTQRLSRSSASAATSARNGARNRRASGTRQRAPRA